MTSNALKLTSRQQETVMETSFVVANTRLHTIRELLELRETLRGMDDDFEPLIHLAEALTEIRADKEVARGLEASEHWGSVMNLLDHATKVKEGFQQLGIVPSE